MTKNEIEFLRKEHRKGTLILYKYDAVVQVISTQLIYFIDRRQTPVDLDEEHFYNFKLYDEVRTVHV